MTVRMFKIACFLIAIILKVQQIATEEVKLPLQINASPSTPLTTQPSVSPHKTSTYSNWSNETKFRLRKCCGPGQVYHINTQVEGNNRCVNYSISASHPSSTMIEISQQLFFSKETLLPQYATEDFLVDAGFPRNCTPDLTLEPDTLMADRFYPLASGQLVVPHRFWLLQPEDHCMEDFFYDDDFNRAKRVAFLCTDNIQQFPGTAVDDHGKLQLDFIQSTKPDDLSAMAGQTVVRKCCDRNEIFSLDNMVCMANQGLATEFFDDMQATANNELFFRIGLLFSCPFKQQTTEFRLLNGSLQLRMNAESDWNEQLFSTDNYCLEDFVTSASGLPETINVASYCTDQIPVDHIPFPVEENETEVYYDNLVKTKIPKCCSPGYVMEEETCKPLGLRDSESIVANALNSHLRDTYNISSILIPNSSISCGFANAHSLLATSGSTVKLKFEFQTERNFSLSLHFYVKNYWDFELKLQDFCVDFTIFRNLEAVSNYPEVFYCASPSHVSGHYPVLLSISAAALLITFIIYFFVPASGTAKLVTSFGSKNARGRRTPSMAMMLTGRILLCHVFTLALTFIFLAIGQHEYFSTGLTSCTALGFLIYGASIASFSWLTVYCFDYCRIFSGSFKVSNEMLFLPYSAFGWGVPLLAVTSAAITQFHSVDLKISSILNPNMGLLRCWFSGGKSAMIFFYIPVSVLILINILFFLTLLFNPNLMNCWKKKQQISVRANRNAPKVSKEQQDFRMAIKLFFITGVPWVFEVAAWLPIYLTDVPTFRTNSQYFFEVSNLLNSLRGVIIFIIFVVLQRDVRRFLMKRVFNIKDSVKEASNQRTSNGQSQSYTTSTHRPATSNTRLSITSSSVTSIERDDHSNKPDLQTDESTNL